MNYIISTNNLTKKYGEDQVLNNVNIHIPENKVYCLLGPNGAGKTTLMKILTGITSSTGGQILFDGHEWSRKDLQYIGSLIENAPIYGNLTSEENLEVIANLRGVKKSSLKTILDKVGLSKTGRKLARDFSLGMKERLGIGIALVGNPKLLILDEPTNGLDPIGIQQLRELINELKNSDISIIISSHMLSEVEHLADFIGIISNGRLLLEQAYDHQSNLENIFNSALENSGGSND